jgi:hypothetical protein
LAGLLYGLFRRTSRLDSYFQGERGNFLIGAGLAVIANIILAMRFGMLYDQGQGRFLFPLLIPLALFLAFGLTSLRLPEYVKDSHIHTIGFFVLYVTAFTSYSLGYFASSWLKWIYVYFG